MAIDGGRSARKFAFTGVSDISQMAPERRPIEGRIAGWGDIVQPDFGVLALSAAP